LRGDVLPDHPPEAPYPAGARAPDRARGAADPARGGEAPDADAGGAGAADPCGQHAAPAPLPVHPVPGPGHLPAAAGLSRRAEPRLRLSGLPLAPRAPGPALAVNAPGSAGSGALSDPGHRGSSPIPCRRYSPPPPGAAPGLLRHPLVLPHPLGRILADPDRRPHLRAPPLPRYPGSLPRLGQPPLLLHSGAAAPAGPGRGG